MYTSNLRYQVPPKTGVLGGGYTNGPPLSGTPKSVHFSIGLCCRFLSSETLNCNPPQIGGRGGVYLRSGGVAGGRCGCGVLHI